ncbi:hypothetical protein ECTW09195_4361, partial [Escherichia coli TW09195]
MLQAIDNAVDLCLFVFPFFALLRSSLIIFFTLAISRTDFNKLSD